MTRKPREWPEVAVGMGTYVAVVTASEATDHYGLWGWPDVILGALPAVVFWIGILWYGSLRVKREKAPIIEGIESLRRDIARIRGRA